MSDTPPGGDDDYIYRGEPSTPQDGQPWDPPAPPPVTPPPATPYPTAPPPGFPPQQPPTGEPLGAAPAPQKKKRWPWIVAGLVLFCGLPLGGCIGLVAFGVSELNERADEIEATTAEFWNDVASGQRAAAENLTDGQAPCTPSAQLVGAFDGLESGATWTVESTGFVERSVNSSLSSNADPETLFIDGRPTASAAVVEGTLTTSTGIQDVQVLLSKPGSQWRICTIALR